MKAHLPNAAWGVLDYAAYPVAMLLATPMLLPHLGTAQYGVWALCTAAVSSGGIIAAGFGDANIQLVSRQRSLGDNAATIRAVRSMFGLNLILGLVVMSIGLALVPMFAGRISGPDPSLHDACVRSLCTACVLMLLRAVESVCISTQRAFQRYGRAIGVSLAARILVVALACAIAHFGRGVATILAVTLSFTAAGTAVQIVQLRRVLSATTLWPLFDPATARALFSFGSFTWMQAVAGILFTQGDRIIVGAVLGASAVTAYALCIQIAQPLYGVAAAGLHFLFPYLAGRRVVVPAFELRRSILLALAANSAFVVVAAVLVELAGKPLLHLWVGKELAVEAASTLSPIVWSFALVGLSVTGSYALLAFGRVRLVTCLNVLGGASMLLMLYVLLPRLGLLGIALSRLTYGGILLALYLPLARMLFPQRLAGAPVVAVCEEA